MAAVNSVKTVNYSKNDKQILIAPELAFTIGCLVTNTGISADSEGRKILKAGTPIGGGDILTNRQAVLTKNTEAPVGVILHDVDVTAGQENATIVLEGTVDVEKLESDVKGFVNTAKANLTNIRFMSGSKV